MSAIDQWHVLQLGGQLLPLVLSFLRQGEIFVINAYTLHRTVALEEAQQAAKDVAEEGWIDGLEFLLSLYSLKDLGESRIMMAAASQGQILTMKLANKYGANKYS